ncbi:MAG: hypothetical protein ACR2PA_08980 [Hyphomicrobiaceae bacterium]
MVNHLVIGLWVCLVALGSTYAGATLMGGDPDTKSAKKTEKLEHIKMRPIAVPVVRDGRVQGYAIASLIYTIGKGKAKKLPMAPDVPISDEVIHAIYLEDGINFGKMKRVNLKKLLKTVKESVNARYGTKVIKHIMLDQLRFVASEDIRKKSDG